GHSCSISRSRCVSFFVPRPAARSTLFPYTTLFRSSAWTCGCPSIFAGSRRSARMTSVVWLVDSSARPWARTIGSRAAVYQPHDRSEEHTSELQTRGHLVCRLLLEKKKKKQAHKALI